MIFYPSRRNNHTVRRLSSPRTLSSDAGDATHITWMLKSFVMGITLLGLSYWLVQIAGVQYLATLTSATLLAFLLAYVVWCLLHKNRVTRQNSDSSSRAEAGNSSNLGATTDALTPTPPPPFDHHQAYKFHTPLPPRDSSPPPTYEEAVRAMLAMTAPTPTAYNPRNYTTPPSSITTSTVSALNISPTSAFTPPSPVSPQSALTPRQSAVLPISESEQSHCALNRHSMSHVALNQSQNSLSALNQHMLPIQGTSALRTQQTNALTPRNSSSSLEESNIEALRISPASMQQFPIALSSQSEHSMSSLGLREAQRSSPTAQLPMFAPTSLSTRSRQQTPPPQPSKSPSVYEIGDIS